jgi:NADH dehydrogenase
MQSNKKHIVIVGAGFAGLKLARKLNNHPAYSITLLDKNNYHQFQPLLYQVAVANLDASNISFPLRTIFKTSKNVKIRVETVVNIDVSNSLLQTNCTTLKYDYLVIATGANTNFFGNESIEQHAMSMKSTWEALQIRNTLIKLFEDAVSQNVNNKQNDLSIVIVGGGPTGVELSGALAEMKRDSLPLEYPDLDFTQMKIYLLEGTNKLLANMSATASTTAQKYLEAMGVLVKTNTIVKQYDGKLVLLQDGSTIKSTFVIWAAGVVGSIPAGMEALIFKKTNQLNTDIFNKVISTKNVFAIGDIAHIETKNHPKGFPQLASVAIDQAQNLAINFKRMSKQLPLFEYRYSNKGNMATIGRNKAVVDLVKPALSFKGFFAWIVWMTLHLLLLVGFKNKLVVFINWMYKYFTHRQSLALLFAPIARNNSLAFKYKESSNKPENAKLTENK